MKLGTVYIGIADNNTIFDKKFDEFAKSGSVLLFLSRINYEDISIDDLLKFVTNHYFLPRWEDYKFVVDHRKDPKYTILSGLLIQSKYFEVFMDNGTKYIVTNCPILNENKLNDLKPNTKLGWAAKYDGRFGYAITQHDGPEEVVYFKYATGINHNHLQKLDGKGAHTIVRL